MDRGFKRKKAVTDLIAGILVFITIIGLFGGVYYYQLRQKALAEEGIEIRIIARQWVFEPNEIVVRKGQKITLILTSADVIHGFMIEGYGINVMIEPGKTTIITFIADKPGVYEFRCSIYCGEPWLGSGLGHWIMRGTLRVIEI